MVAAAASHAELARALQKEQPKNAAFRQTTTAPSLLDLGLSQVEVLAHWLGHLRAGGEEETALEQAPAVQRKNGAVAPPRSGLCRFRRSVASGWEASLVRAFGALPHGL